MPEPPPTAALRFDLARLIPIPPRRLLAAIVALALLVVLVELPGRPLILHVLQKLGHPASFGGIALCVLVVVRQRSRGPRAPGLDYLIALIAAAAIGGATEVLQVLTHRDPALRDVGLDVRGAACALALAAFFDVRCRTGRFGNSRRALYAAVAALLAALILWPLAWTIAGYSVRAARFPVLFVPDGRLDLLFVSVSGARSDRIAVPPSFAHAPGEVALRVPLLEQSYAGVWLDEPAPDWRNHRTLAVEVTNPGDRELPLTVRVHDHGHDWTYEDRFNARVVIAGGERRTLEFSLDEIRAAPRGRPLDLAHVAGLAIFRAGPGSASEFWLHRVELR